MRRFRPAGGTAACYDRNCCNSEAPGAIGRRTRPRKGVSCSAPWAEASDRAPLGCERGRGAASRLPPSAAPRYFSAARRRRPGAGANNRYTVVLERMRATQSCFVPSKIYVFPPAKIPRAETLTGQQGGAECCALRSVLPSCTCRPAQPLRADHHRIASHQHRPLRHACAVGPSARSTAKHHPRTELRRMVLIQYEPQIRVQVQYSVRVSLRPSEPAVPVLYLYSCLLRGLGQTIRIYSRI